MKYSDANWLIAGRSTQRDGASVLTEAEQGHTVSEGTVTLPKPVHMLGTAAEGATAA